MPISAKNAALLADAKRILDEEPGISNSEIGYRLGVTKNVIVGLLRRNGITTGNPCSIRTVTFSAEDVADVIERRRSGETSAQVARRYGVSMSYINKLTQDQNDIKPSIRRAERVEPLPPLPALAEPAMRQPGIPAPPPPRPTLVRRAANDTQGCLYPIGEPGSRDFRFCGEPPVPGRPYCKACMGICYRPISKFSAA